MELSRLLLLGLVATSPLATAALASPSSSASVDRDDAPFAEAGLDQASTVGDRVLLDGGGSRSTAGDVLEYNWTIAGPNGTSVRPSCQTCVRTSFVPNRPGQYAVTLTVTDADGRTDSDTMYVAADSVAVPDISVSGPGRIATDRATEFTAEVRPGDAELTHVSWTVDGSSVGHSPLDGDRNASLERTFTSVGRVRVNATVHDRAGRERTATQPVDVVARTRSGSATSSPSLSVHGPRVLTGEAPFEGTYRIEGPDADDVEAVTWLDGDGSRGSGPTLDAEWEPALTS